MSRERILVDTAFVQALLSARDQNHATALANLPRMRRAAEVWVTEAVFIEVADGLCSIDRKAAADWIETCYRTANIRVAPVTTELIRRALNLYSERDDKQWSLTDCISFVVMQENGLTAALTSDKHFIQAGFRALLLEEA
jgi:uncharacterized protein